MAEPIVKPTIPRAYTLKLSGEGNWRELLWTTHVTVNPGAQAWADWLLSLRGGLPAALADDATILPVTETAVGKELKRRKLKADATAAVKMEMEVNRRRNLRVVLALSWLSVESPASLVPHQHIVARGSDEPELRERRVMERFRTILDRLDVQDQPEWIEACEPTLTARIRDDAVWVDRSGCFADAVARIDDRLGFREIWDLLGRFFGRPEQYFQQAVINDEEGSSLSQEKSRELVKEAIGWLCDRFGESKGADYQSLSSAYARLAVLCEGIKASSVKVVLEAIASQFGVESAPKSVLACFGASGHKSMTRNMLAELATLDTFSAETLVVLASQARKDSETCKKKIGRKCRHVWAGAILNDVERTCCFSYKTATCDKPHRSEYSVLLDHAARRVKLAHTWIKRAEAQRSQFREDAAKLDSIPSAARQWLDAFREGRELASGALGEYIIRKRAIDGWEKVVRAWTELGLDATRKERIDAAGQVQANLDENEKFGDIQLFAGYGDDANDDPQPCLADDDAKCVWQDAQGSPAPSILKDYVAATVARHDERRFKVPAYRHPDPLRHPIYVDFGNSRWGITYAALKAAGQRPKLRDKLAKTKTEKTRARLREQLDTIPDLRGVTLDVWTGAEVEQLSLRWHGKRFWKALDLDHFDQSEDSAVVSRADRLGRVVADKSRMAAVRISDVLDEDHWNGRLQVPRYQLDQLGDLVYAEDDGHRTEPDYANLDRVCSTPRAKRRWERLDWFLTTSAKLRPQGPWLDYVNTGLPEGIEYRSGRNGWYLYYAVNEKDGRKGRARVELARLPGLRLLSVDLGHRYAAACAVWETLTADQMAEACRAAGHRPPNGDDLYLHLRRSTDKLQKSGRNKGQPVTETTVYRRIGPDSLPDGSVHAAPWARLERQFLIRLQGEERPARWADEQEVSELNNFRAFLGLPAIADTLRADDLQREAVRLARLGLRRLADAATIAFALTATKKPRSGGREVPLTAQGRIEYVQDSLLRWQQLAGSSRYRDEWAKHMWETWVVGKLGGPQPVDTDADGRPIERKKRREAARATLRAVAEQLADPQSAASLELHRLWKECWKQRSDQWQGHLRWLRRLILPRKNDFQHKDRDIRRVGGLSMKRLKTIRELYQVLKAFHMRPEPENPRKNVPEPGDDSLANFGRRILNQLERLREQRIKQLASRVVEAALGAGRMKRPMGRARKRPDHPVDRPCHAVVVENLEYYKPEQSRLRRENRQLMDWAARNVRKYLVEGCELHGLHFVEVSPNYTSRQDSRTGAPGLRCEDVPRSILEEAARRVASADVAEPGTSPAPRETRWEWQVRRWTAELKRLAGPSREPSPRDRLLAAVVDALPNMPDSRTVIRLPRPGGELFVSAGPDSPGSGAIQADLNAAANIGLRALTDPDWMAAWWFVLVNAATGQPIMDKVQGCPVWADWKTIWDTTTTRSGDEQDKGGEKKSAKRARGARAEVYGWNPMLSPGACPDTWLPTQDYWPAVERRVAQRLQFEQTQADSPF